MIAKVVTKHYETNGDSRFIDIGDDFKIYSVTKIQIFNRYYNFTNTISEENANQENYIYCSLFDLEVYNNFIYDKLDRNFYNEFNKITNLDEFNKILDKYGRKDLYAQPIVINRNSLLGPFPNADNDRYTALQYETPEGKTVIEIFYCKDVYILNEEGKTIEVYRNNFITK